MQAKIGNTVIECTDAQTLYTQDSDNVRLSIAVRSPKEEIGYYTGLCSGKDIETVTVTDSDGKEHVFSVAESESMQCAVSFRDSGTEVILTFFVKEQ